MRNSLPYQLSKHTAQKLLKIDFVRFGIVGSVGFIVTLVLKLTLFRGLETYLALFLSSEGGMISNFVFHEKWTYNHVDHSGKPLWKKFIHFQMSSLSGVLIVTVISGFSLKTLHLPTLPSLMIGAAIAMFWNYFWTKFYIFNNRTPSILHDPEDTVPMRKVNDKT